MDNYSFTDVIDGHTHIERVEEAKRFSTNLDAVRTVQAGVACQYDDSLTNSNPAGFVLKSRDPGRFYILAGLEHTSLFNKSPHSLTLQEQAKRLLSIGVDGIKILASKPTWRKRLNQPVDGPYFQEFFKICATEGLPLLWHVADPEEFWEPDRLPEWARKQGWGYDGSFPSKEDLYRESLHVLEQNPGLVVIFPHFYFLSADLDRAGSLLVDHPNVFLDLAPGIELLYNLSKNKKRSFEFLCEYSDRILFGTDIVSSHSVSEMRIRAGILQRFLTSDDSFHLPKGADPLLGKPEDGIIQGLNLPGGIVNSITIHNFRRIFGQLPKMMNIAAARDECLRLAKLEADIGGMSTEETDGHKAAVKLGKLTLLS
ncbi:MAG: hypothetical protein ABIJ35_05725 [Acidobacteriota bacterium]